jgi:PKD repeat protein
VAETLNFYRISPQGSLPGNSFNWSYTTPFNLSPGNYEFYVGAIDDEELSTPSSQYGFLRFTAGFEGDAPPTVTISPVGTQPQEQDLHLDLAGTAADDVGVAEVRVTLRDQDTARFVQDDGSLAATYNYLSATLATPNGTSTNWTLPVDLDEQGDYAVTSFAVDTQGQLNTVTSNTTSRYPVYPGDLPPTVTDNLLAVGSTDAKIFVSGRLEDDQQIAEGQVAIVNSLGQYMRSAGNFSSGESWRTAFLNSPGSPGSNFSYTTPAIVAGDYTVLVRGIDQHGLVTVSPYPSRTITVAAVNSQPPVANFPAPTCTQNVCSFDGRSSTDENPTALTYSWTFGTSQGSSTSPVPTRTYTAPGDFTVSLTVRDEFGLTSAPFTRIVTIAEPTGNVAPTPVFNLPACSGQVCNVSAVGTTDPNVGDVIRYAWTFGDNVGTSTSSSTSYSYPAAGTYTITLTVTDGWGKAASTTRSVTVPAA